MIFSRQPRLCESGRVDRLDRLGLAGGAEVVGVVVGVVEDRETSVLQVLDEARRIPEGIAVLGGIAPAVAALARRRRRERAFQIAEDDVGAAGELGLDRVEVGSRVGWVIVRSIPEHRVAHGCDRDRHRLGGGPGGGSGARPNRRRRPERRRRGRPAGSSRFVMTIASDDADDHRGDEARGQQQRCKAPRSGSERSWAEAGVGRRRAMGDTRDDRRAPRRGGGIAAPWWRVSRFARKVIGGPCV